MLKSCQLASSSTIGLLVGPEGTELVTINPLTSSQLMGGLSGGREAD